MKVSLMSLFLLLSLILSAQEYKTIKADSYGKTVGYIYDSVILFTFDGQSNADGAAVTDSIQADSCNNVSNVLIYGNEFHILNGSRGY
jgi:hypothetical protein